MRDDSSPILREIVAATVVVWCIVTLVWSVAVSATVGGHNFFIVLFCSLSAGDDSCVSTLSFQLIDSRLSAYWLWVFAN